MPRFRLCAGTSTFSVALEMSLSPTWTSPPSGVSKPAMMFKVVVLPQPLGPSRVSSLPLGTSKETPSTAVTSPNLLTSFSTRTFCIR